MLLCTSYTVRVTYMAILVHVIVGQFGFLKADHLLSQLLSGEGRIRVQVKADRRRLVCLTSHQPRGSMVRIAIPFVVHGHDVHQYCIARIWIGVVKRDATGGKHSA